MLLVVHPADVLHASRDSSLGPRFGKRLLLHCPLACLVSDQKIPTYVVSFLFLSLSQIFSLSLVLSNLILTFLGVVFLMFLMLGVHWASSFWGFTVSFKSQNICPINPHKCFSLTHSLLSFSHINTLGIVPQLVDSLPTFKIIVFSLYASFGIAAIGVFELTYLLFCNI